MPASLFISAQSAAGQRVATAASSSKPAAVPVVMMRRGAGGVAIRHPQASMANTRPSLRRVRAAAAISDRTPSSGMDEEQLLGENYVCLGLAQCFKKADGTLQAVLVIEPLSASSLECLANGARTSFKAVTGTTLADAMTKNRAALPEAFATGVWCENYQYRLEAAARTWLRPHAQDNLMDIVPLGKARSNFNFSLEDKRILNVENVVSDSDNVKQDMSIDVYGRKKADEYKAKELTPEEQKAADVAAKRAQTDADLDTLLTA